MPSLYLKISKIYYKVYTLHLSASVTGNEGNQNFKCLRSLSHKTSAFNSMQMQMLSYPTNHLVKGKINNKFRQKCAMGMTTRKERVKITLQLSFLFQITAIRSSALDSNARKWWTCGSLPKTTASDLTSCLRGSVSRAFCFFCSKFKLPGSYWWRWLS